MKSEVIFADEKLEKEFSKLKEVKEKQFYEQLINAFKNLKENAFCGTQIPKNLIPKEYIKKTMCHHVLKDVVVKGTCF